MSDSEFANLQFATPDNSSLPPGNRRGRRIVNAIARKLGRGAACIAYECAKLIASIITIGLTMVVVVSPPIVAVATFLGFVPHQGPPEALGFSAVDVSAAFDLFAHTGALPDLVQWLAMKLALMTDGAVTLYAARNLVVFIVFMTMWVCLLLAVRYGIPALWRAVLPSRKANARGAVQ